MVERFFTPEDANKALPEIRKIVEEILMKANEARELLKVSGTSSDAQMELIELNKHMNALMARLEDRGCYYKDWNFEIGLVDFPAIIHGQPALLCWRSDEAQVGWFHGYEDGYAGRRRVTRELIFS